MTDPLRSGPTGTGAGPLPASAPDELAADVLNFPVDSDWLALRADEAVLEPDLVIVDPHHHMWDRPGSRYLTPDLLADIGEGHRVVASVYVENNAAYRSWGPVAMRPVGETEVMAAIADGWTAGADAPRINAGIVGYADLFAGAASRAVLESHIALGRGRFRGIRQVTAWDEARSIQLVQHGPRRAIARGMLGDADFRAGFACLAPLGLSFDAWLYHPQLPELAGLARAFPETTIVVNHVGGPINVGPYRGRSDQVFADWSAAIADLARCPNVVMKLGGLGMRLLGFGFRERAAPPTSAELAGLWRPYVEHCIARFGTERCMFESNFPVDKAYYGYRECWNAFKRLAAGASSEEKRDLFAATATRIYRLAA